MTRPPARWWTGIVDHVSQITDTSGRKLTFTHTGRRVYLPASWTDNRQRCQAAGVPDEIGFATKPDLAVDMITTALNAGVPAGWAAADEAYGNSAIFRAHLREHGLGYVLAVSCSHLITLDGDKTRVRADRIAADLPVSAWQRRSASAGSKGPRFYDWAWLDDVAKTLLTALINHEYQHDQWTGEVRSGDLGHALPDRPKSDLITERDGYLVVCDPRW